ncbi:UNVERIFIED_CONTAM: hypothetical protein Scaly_1303600 [Sesamum calycinum]|uniref:Rho termination factor-like N-terminal domain-containing protein n=1 Tax=Sesamum calycinum TaxID=2727403 RepID=A0AAW2Q6T3_9LAMI
MGGGSVLYPHSVLHLPSFSAATRPKFGVPIFSVKEIANRFSVPGIRADGNRERSQKNFSPGRAPKADAQEDNPQSLDGRSSPNKEEILALFKRIQSSISKGEKRNSKVAEDNPSAESIWKFFTNQGHEEKYCGFLQSLVFFVGLHLSLCSLTAKSLGKKGGKLPSVRKESLNKEERVEHSTMGLRSTRPPSSFTRRSPIPTLSSQRDEIQQKSETSPETVKRDETQLKNETLLATDDDNDQPPEIIKFEEMKLAELKEVAKSKGIRGYSKLKKSELVELLISSLNNASP